MDDIDSNNVVTQVLGKSRLKLLFLAHFILTSWGIQGYWSPDSYFFYNLIFFFTLFWSIQDKESAEGPFLCLIINIAAIFLDITVLSIYFPERNYGRADGFSVGMAVLNLILRPVSCIVIHNIWKKRNVSSPQQGERGERNNYESM